MLKYEPGQFYDVHHDYVAAHATMDHGPRVLTMLVYLNDDGLEGGSTRFPNLGELAWMTARTGLGGMYWLWCGLKVEGTHRA